jgi:hypothetical protein
VARHISDTDEQVNDVLDKTLAIILAGGIGSRLFPLTEERAHRRWLRGGKVVGIFCRENATKRYCGLQMRGRFPKLVEKVLCFYPIEAIMRAVVAGPMGVGRIVGKIQRICESGALSHTCCAVSSFSSR